jgi:hypothetical protein
MTRLFRALGRINVEDAARTGIHFKLCQAKADVGAVGACTPKSKSSTAALMDMIRDNGAVAEILCENVGETLRCKSSHIRFRFTHESGPFQSSSFQALHRIGSTPSQKFLDWDSSVCVGNHQIEQVQITLKPETLNNATYV